ncbi:MAG: hypothetical protein ABJA67_08450 [Chthonomonadales bacterium]
MVTIPVQLDDATERTLKRLIDSDSVDVSAVASKLLARAARDARSRRVFDPIAIKAVYAEFEAEELQLAESGAV